MGPTYDRGCWHVVSRPLFLDYCLNSSSIKAVYDPKAFILHAALLHQTFVHCGKFPTAASRRSLGRVSVPVWLIILSDQLKIVVLVSFYLTNKLILRRLLPKRPKPLVLRPHAVLDTISGAYPSLWGTFLRVTQPSAARVLSHIIQPFVFTQPGEKR